MRTKPLTIRTFVCAECDGQFAQKWSDAEANEEARRTFGVDDARAAGFVEVCDDCYQKIMARRRTWFDESEENR